MRHPSSTIPAMGPRLRWVRFGPPAARALREELARAKDGMALAPVNVVVSSNQVGVTARRLLGSGSLGPVCGSAPGLAAVSFLTPYRLAELLGAERLARAGRRPVSTPVLAEAIRAALREAPGIFGPVAGHPATELALIGVYKELRDCSSAALERLAASGERARDVVRLHRAARARIAGTHYDEEDLAAAAVEVLAAGGAGAMLVQPTIVYLPGSLSRHEAALLSTLGEAAPLVVLAGTTGAASADAATLRSVRRLCPEGAAPGTESPLSMVSVERTRLCATSDADEEARAALRAVVDAAREGTPLERIAILYPAPGPYARILEEGLTATGIPHNGAAAAPLASSLAARTFLGLLALARTRARREECFAWLAGAPLHEGGHPLPVATWERLSRAAGVVGGRAEWDGRLQALADEEDAAARRADADPDRPGWLAARHRDDAREARALREFVLGLLDDLADAAHTPRPWASHARWALDRLRSLLPRAARATWPTEEVRRAERFERILERLAKLEGRVHLEVFERTLQLELRADSGRAGRLGEGVLVGPLAFGIGLDLELLIVVGMAEGTLPAPVQDDSLLPDHERARAGDELAPRSGSVADQHHALLAALAGARRHLLVLPRGDLRRSNERVPSRWVVEIAVALLGRPCSARDLLGLRAPFLEHVASFDDGLRRTAFPASAQEHRLRVLLASRARPAPEHLGDTALSAAAAVVRARRSNRFTRFDGNLAGLGVPSPAASTTSATRLEHWSTCPFAYFLGHVLGIEPVENPEDRLTISPLDFGSLVHEVLEHFVDEAVVRPAEQRLAPGEAWTEADRERLLELATAACGRYESRGLVGRPIFWAQDRRRLLADLERLLEEDSAHRAVARTRPVAAELMFGLPGAELADVALALPEGRTVRFRGKADRLDVAEDGSAEVIDYKTGRDDDYAELSAERPDDRGRHLQLAVYALAARARLGAHVPVRARYWFATTRGGFRRRGYEVTPEVLARVGQTVGHVVTSIEAGAFPHLPAESPAPGFVACPFCDPDGLGVADLRRQLEAKRSDPGLAHVLALAEGLLEARPPEATGAPSPGAGRD